jgi:hypothetical protein
MKHMDETATTLPPVEAEVRESGELRLVVDPIALSALAVARAAGVDQPTQLGQLPQADDLPLAVVVIEARLDVLEARLDQVEQWVNLARARV